MPHHTCFECSAPFRSSYLPKGKPQSAPLCERCAFETEGGQKELAKGWRILDELMQRPTTHKAISAEVYDLVYEMNR